MRAPLKAILYLTAATTALCSCSIDDQPPKQSQTPTVQATPSARPTYPASSEEPNVRLTVTTLAANAGAQSTQHLVCVGPSAIAGTDIPDANAACRVLDQQPDLLDYDSAETSEECEAVGQPNIADVFGEINGETVRTSFRRDNTCNVETWDRLKTLLGTVTEK